MRPILTLPEGAKPRNGKGHPVPVAPSELIADIADRHNLTSTEANALQTFCNGANAAVRSWREKPKPHEKNALAAEVDRWAWLNARPNPLRGG